LADPTTERCRAVRAIFAERRTATMRGVVKIDLFLIAIAAAGTLGVEAFRPVPRVAPPSPPVRVVTVPVRQRNVPDHPRRLRDRSSTEHRHHPRQCHGGLLQTVNFVEGRSQRGPAIRRASNRRSSPATRRSWPDAQVNLERNLPLLKRGFATG
jgi:hypothetical protein